MLPDMLVKLYELPPLEPDLEKMADLEIEIRLARPPEKPRVLDFMSKNFEGWSSEASASFNSVPSTCFLAVRDKEILGFACYDIFCPNFFGPTGVAESEQRKGIGRALLLASLYALKAQGYGYAIIGCVGPIEYYEKTVGATVIEGSDPGMFRDLLT
jgi:GNAT superfamily N-acetyltransferase